MSDLPRFFPMVDRTMTPNEFRALQQRLGLDQERIAKFLGVSVRSIRRYSVGEAAIPVSTVLLLRMIERYGLNIAV